MHADRMGLDALAPARTRLLIQPAQRLFPAEAARKLPVSIHDIGAPDCSPASRRRDAERARFSHAKVILVTGGGHDHVLSGSANCTWAALGGAGRGGINGEASVYRRLPAGRLPMPKSTSASSVRPAPTSPAMPTISPARTWNDTGVFGPPA